MRIATLALLTTLTIAACSGADKPSPVAPSPPAAPATPSEPPPNPGPVRITAAGFTPREVTTTIGSTVTFINEDVRPHDLLGGPDHLRRDCAEVDVVGFLVPGQSRDTAVFSQARTCEFHDHNNLGNAAFQGRITIR